MVDDKIFVRQAVAVGGEIETPPTPTKASTAQYTFTFKGWSLDGVNVVDHLGTMGEESVVYYAIFDEVLRNYTIRFYSGTTLLQTQQVAYGTTPTYTGTTPTMDGKDFGGWIPELAPVTGDADYVAKFIAPSVTRSLILRTITEYSDDMVSTIGYGAFQNCGQLRIVNIPNVTKIERNGFITCGALSSVHLPATPPNIADTSAFLNVPTSCVFYIPTGSLSAYQSATNWSSLTSKYSFVEEGR
jgi:hypothetical protein